MATAATTSASPAPSPLVPLPGLTATPSASWGEVSRGPEWHSLRLFGHGRHAAGFEIGNEPRLAGL
jgi:hypothetical protein